MEKCGIVDEADIFWLRLYKNANWKHLDHKITENIGYDFQNIHFHFLHLNSGDDTTIHFKQVWQFSSLRSK